MTLSQKDKTIYSQVIRGEGGHDYVWSKGVKLNSCYYEDLC